MCSISILPLTKFIFWGSSHATETCVSFCSLLHFMHSSLIVLSTFKQVLSVFTHVNLKPSALFRQSPRNTGYFYSDCKVPDFGSHEHINWSDTAWWPMFVLCSLWRLLYFSRSWLQVRTNHWQASVWTQPGRSALLWPFTFPHKTLPVKDKLSFIDLQHSECFIIITAKL